MNNIVCLSALSFVFFTSPVKAEAFYDLLALDIESLMDVEVFVASRDEEKLSEAPGVVSVLTRQEIKDSGALNLMQVLQRMPGVLGTYNHILHYNSTGVRGDSPTTGNGHTLFTLNGRPIRSTMAPGVDEVIFATIPVDFIERIELIRGPGSVLYGTNAFNSVVNIITQETDEDISGAMSVGYGSFNTRTSEGRLGINGDGYRVDVAGSYTGSDGFEVKGYDFLGNYGEDYHDNVGNSVVVNAEYGGFTLNALRGYHSASSFTAPHTFPFFDKMRKRYFLDIGYEFELFDDWQVNLNGSFNEQNIRYTNLSDYDSDSLGGEFAIRGELIEGVDFLLGGTHEILRGKERVFVYDYVTKRSGIYSQIDYKPTDWLKLIAGAQINKVSDVPKDFSPRLGAILKLNDNWGGKLLYADAFRSAFPFEQFADIPFVIQGTRGLKPEKSETYDAQIYYQHDNVYVALDLFTSTYSEVIGLEFTGIQKYANGGEIRTSGATVESKFHLNGDWSFTGSATYQDNEDEAGNNAFFTPTIFAKAGFTYKGWDGFTIDVFDQYANSSKLDETSAQTNPNPDAYHNLTANINVDLNKVVDFVPEGVGFSLYGYNLLDENILETQVPGLAAVNAIQTRSGRAVYAKLSYKF